MPAAVLEMTGLLQHPVVLLVLCFALVGTPVSYRGGASHAHPHMFLEFLLDATEGSFDHHHGEQTDADAADAAEHHHHPVDSAGTDAQPALDGAERFAPTLSAFVVGDVGQLAFIVPQDAFAATADVATAFQPFDTPPQEPTHAPVAPPPR